MRDHELIINYLAQSHHIPFTLLFSSPCALYVEVRRHINIARGIKYELLYTFLASNSHRGNFEAASWKRERIIKISNSFSPARLLDEEIDLSCVSKEFSLAATKGKHQRHNSAESFLPINPSISFDSSSDFSPQTSSASLI